MTLDCVKPTQFSVVQTIYCNVGLKCFFPFYQNVCLLLSLCMHILLIFHKVVQTRINGVVGSMLITLSQIFCRVCQLNNFENRSIIAENMDKSKVARFCWPTQQISQTFACVRYQNDNWHRGWSCSWCNDHHRHHCHSHSTALQETV